MSQSWCSLRRWVCQASRWIALRVMGVLVHGVLVSRPPHGRLREWRRTRQHVRVRGRSYQVSVSSGLLVLNGSSDKSLVGVVLVSPQAEGYLGSAVILENLHFFIRNTYAFCVVFMRKNVPTMRFGCTCSTLGYVAEDEIGMSNNFIGFEYCCARTRPFHCTFNI